MAGLPLKAKVLVMAVMATNMPYVGRGETALVAVGFSQGIGPADTPPSPPPHQGGGADRVWGRIFCPLG